MPGPRAVLAAGAVYAALGVWGCYLGILLGRPWIVLGLAPVLVVPFLRDRPLAAGVAMALGGTFLRAALVGTGPQTDQVETTQAALALVLGGGNPYGAGIAGTSTGAPFPYGPLALLAYAPGTWTEVAAAGVTMLLMAWARAPIALAAYATVPDLLRATVMGTNDILPGALVTAAVLLVVARPVVAGALLALAVGVKPYALAWLPGLAGVGGAAAVLAFAGVSALAWAPLLAWGPAAYARSVALADAPNAPAAGLVDPRPLRLLAIPAAALAWLAARRVRTMETAAIGGVAVFLVAVLPANAGSLTYLLTPLPLVLIVLEQQLRARLKASVA